MKYWTLSFGDFHRTVTLRWRFDKARLMTSFLVRISWISALRYWFLSLFSAFFQFADRSQRDGKPYWNSKLIKFWVLSILSNRLSVKRRGAPGLFFFVLSLFVWSNCLKRSFRGSSLQTAVCQTVFRSMKTYLFHKGETK